MDKLGVIAGGGDLPGALVRACRGAGRPYAVLRIQGMADPALADEPGDEVPIARLGRFLDVLRREGCRAVTFVGRVQRPDFATLKPDLMGMKALPAVLKAAGQGDDALLRAILNVFEREGFRIEGADQVSAALTLPPGSLGAVSPTAADLGDVAQAADVARAVGRFDVGQAVVAGGGLILAVEAQEGTAAMLDRVAGLPRALRPTGRGGVLVKLPKPIQDRRVDLPTIGVETVSAVARAGLAGIAGEAGQLLVIDREAVRAAADEAGVFVFGLDPGAA